MFRSYLLICLCLFFSSVNGQSFQWVAQVSGLSEELGTDVAVDKDGSIYACGSFGNTALFAGGMETSLGFRDGFIVRYDAQGNELGYTLLNGVFDEEILRIGVDDQKRIFFYAEIGDTCFIQGNPIFTNSTRKTRQWTYPFEKR